jgi:long-chain acyl-CoA synthetase
MIGYYKNPEATAAIFTKDGYLKTGDLGYIDNDGFVFINGRKKNLIVSSGGKNVYPEEIEIQFNGSRVVSEILVLGKRSEAGEIIFAVAVPNYETLAQDHPGRPLSDDLVHSLVKIEVERVNRLLPVYKKISDFTVRSEEFEKNAKKEIRRFLYKYYENG